MQCLVFYEDIIVLALNRIIFLFLWSFYKVCLFFHIMLHSLFFIIFLKSDMTFIMNVINMTLDLNKILWFFITQITALESMILKLQAALDRMNIMSKSASAAKNSYASTVKMTTDVKLTMIIQSMICVVKFDMPVKSPMSKSSDIMSNMKNMNLPYAPAWSVKHQDHMIRRECFGCGQKEHMQKNCSTHSFNKIHSFLKLEATQFIQLVFWTACEPKLLFSKLDMKLVMKAATKPVVNMNMHINLNENTQIVFMKKICIMLFVIFWITFLSKSENKLF